MLLRFKLRLINYIILIIGASVTIPAAPVFASSSVLECRTTLAELEAVKADVNSFNEASALLRDARKKLFDSTLLKINQWGHLFQTAAHETVNEKNEKKFEWFYQEIELSFSYSNIVEENKMCGWVSSKGIVDVFELQISPDNEIISATIKTVK